MHSLARTLPHLICKRGRHGMQLAIVRRPRQFSPKSHNLNLEYNVSRRWNADDRHHQSRPPLSEPRALASGGSAHDLHSLFVRGTSAFSLCALCPLWLILYSRLTKERPMYYLARTSSYFITLSLAAALMAPIQDTKGAPNLDGIWLGTINASGVKLRIAFHVKSKDGKTSTTMDSLDQGVKGIQVNEFAAKDALVRIDVQGIKGTFEGKLNKEATEIVGDWKQGDSTFTLALKRVDKLPAANRPQEPKRPFPYREEEVQYENAKAKIKLAGTLSLPKGAGRFPAALLISGSGPQNRDEELLGHKPFLVIADHLPRHGIAVRVDDRGVGGSTGNVSTSTTADFAEDVLTGIDFLKAHKEIDAKHIGLIGHSEGGTVAPLAATQSKDIAFIIMLAGPACPATTFSCCKISLSSPLAATRPPSTFSSSSCRYLSRSSSKKPMPKSPRNAFWKKSASGKRKRARMRKNAWPSASRAISRSLSR